jgi:hypothetical protein
MNMIDFGMNLQEAGDAPGLNMLAQFYKTNLHWVKEKYSLKAVLI